MKKKIGEELVDVYLRCVALMMRWGKATGNTRRTYLSAKEKEHTYLYRSIPLGVRRSLISSSLNLPLRYPCANLLDPITTLLG